jgi:hypothetical protein
VRWIDLLATDFRTLKLPLRWFPFLGPIQFSVSVVSASAVSVSVASVSGVSMTGVSVTGVSVTGVSATGVSATGVSAPVVTLLLGVSAPVVTFELAGAGAAVEVETLTFVGAGGAHPNVNVAEMAQMATRRIDVTLFISGNLWFEGKRVIERNLLRAGAPEHAPPTSGVGIIQNDQGRSK